ncbi:hypothetical protein ILP92_01515 [Maribius pontilimi]|uniref:Uncharacterized protein n=1 Tax=Palleronia pontilimi TaxID=1964209 RepID=A0A934IGH1_9RHOB|nr:hypothetical protein [Palleronia pontilimi]MBJ3761429.1 hypothetical protein [Palleronia pontilimi]
MTDRDTDPSADLAADLAALKPDAVPDALMARIAEDAMLEQAFHAARATPPRPSDLLMARIARDAKRHQPRNRSDTGAWLTLVAAGVAGLMIGFGGALPDTFSLAQADYDLTPSYDFELLAEE